MFLKKSFLFTFLLSITFNAFPATDIKIYNAMCEMFQDVMKLDLKPQARLNFVNKHFDSRVKSKDAKEAFDMIFQVHNDQRYQIFKQSVESATNQKWTCPALKKFFK